MRLESLGSTICILDSSQLTCCTHSRGISTLGWGLWDGAR